MASGARPELREVDEIAREVEELVGLVPGTVAELAVQLGSVLREIHED
jgi:hypothetical protein